MERGWGCVDSLSQGMDILVSLDSQWGILFVGSLDNGKKTQGVRVVEKVADGISNFFS